MVLARWEYLPSNVIELIVSNFTKLNDLLSCMLVCKKWYYTINDEKSYIWRIFCQNNLSKAVLKSNVLSSLTSYKARLRAHYYSWDPYECSRNIYIKPNGFTLHRNPVAQSKYLVFIFICIF